MKKRLKQLSIITDNLRIIIALGSMLTLLYDVGFNITTESHAMLMKALWVWVFLIFGGIVTDLFVDGLLLRRKVRKAELLLFLFMSVLAGCKSYTLVYPADAPYAAQWVAQNVASLYVAILGFFIIELGKIGAKFSSIQFNPVLVFAGSFLLMILIGTFLLMLPRATTQGISIHDAVFTATSAVCITGLVVLDTGKDFTQFGQIILLCLFQLGGLGVMTFTSFFALFFKGRNSMQESLFMRDYIHAINLSEVTKFIAQVVSLTLFIETVGAIFIYFSLDKNIMPELNERIFFSVFHAVSGFCNAGFCTLSDSLYESPFRFNYPLHIVIMMLVIAGGIGYSILFNFLTYWKHQLKNLIWTTVLRKPATVKPWLINLNTIIVVNTTLILIAAGFVFFYFFEYQNTLAGHESAFGKIVTAFFLSTTPRSGGFNTVITAEMCMPAILFTILLMWIGASPGSTGGGIKTSAFAIAVLNTVSTARGKSRIEVGKREISNLSVRRAFSIITLSVLVISMSLFLLSIFENDKDYVPLVFECFSAYSTVGLSLGVTPELSVPGKYVIAATMFIGRVGALTLLIGMLKQVGGRDYAYPKEFIMMN